MAAQNVSVGSRPIDHIRADLFLGMTDGTYAGLDDPTILERLRTSSLHDSGASHSDEEADESGDDRAPDVEVQWGGRSTPG
jgi:hypothetical protein